MLTALASEVWRDFMEPLRGKLITLLGELYLCSEALAHDAELRP